MSTIPTRLAAGVKASLKWGLGLAGLVLFILWSGGFFHGKTAPGQQADLPGIPSPEHAVWHEVEIEALPSRVEVVGTVAAAELVQLSARIGAVVTYVGAGAGDAVEAGQVLVRLDDRELAEQLAAAEAQMHHARAEFDRAKALFDRQAGTQQALTAAESAFRAANAQLERVRVMRSYTELAAPRAGVVTDRRVEAGDLASPGQVLLALYDPARMRLEAPVPVRLLEYVRLGQDVAVRLDRPQGERRGRVEQIVAEVDPRSRTQLVKIALEAGDAPMLPGTFGRFEIEGPVRETIRVPSSAVYASGQLELVQMEREGRVLRRAVKTGPARDGRVEILSGLRGGERVLVNPVKGS